MDIDLHIEVSDESSNIEVTLQHTGVHYPTHTIIHRVTVTIPDPPEGFNVARITIAQPPVGAGENTK